MTGGFARSRAEGGRFDGIVDLTRLTDGRVMCQLCLDYVGRDQLWRDDEGQAWDVCALCVAWECHTSTRDADPVVDGETNM